MVEYILSVPKWETLKAVYNWKKMMKLQTHAIIGIWVGIGALVFFGFFFGIVMFDQFENQIKMLIVDKDKKLEEIKSLDSYKLLKEKYPDLLVTERNGRHNPGINAVVSNYQTGNLLRFSASYDFWEDSIRQDIRCDVKDHHLREELSYSTKYENEFATSEMPFPLILLTEGRADNNYTHDFIKYTNCLEIDKDENRGKGGVVSPEYGDIPTFTISIPEGSDVPGCENIAQCFSPDKITIKKGDIIEWKNYDDNIHTVTSGDPEDGPTEIFDSGLIESDATFALKFNSVGEFNYFCMVHPWQTGMVIVR